MSVLVIDRKESKLEVIVFPETIHKMLIDLIQRGFGVKDVDEIVRVRYAYGKDLKEDYSKYRLLMHEFKVRIENLASSLANNVRIANSIYPTSMCEYDKRRDYQNMAIGNCEALKRELQSVVEIFEVDINRFAQHISAINREIELIKRWRQIDNKLKRNFQG